MLHIQNATPESSRAALALLRKTIIRISKSEIGLTDFDLAAIPWSVRGRAFYCRAERVSITDGVAERVVGLRERSEKKKRIVAKRRCQAERTARATRGRKHDDAQSLETAHMHYYGNGVWSSQTRHPDAA